MATVSVPQPDVTQALDRVVTDLKAAAGANLLGVALYGGPSPERAVLYDEVAALLHTAAERGPLLLGMEDVDWCDPASVSLLEFLVHHTAGRRLLFAITAIAGSTDGSARAREMRQRQRRLDNVVWVTLRPLGYEAVAGWLTRTLGREAPDELVRYVYGNTEGNAFFIEQVVRSMVERGEMGRLSGESARLELAAAPPPEAVADVVERRLRGMSTAAREILQFAAVAGREFDVDLLVALSRRSEDAILAALDEAEAAGALAPVERSGRHWYRFTHNKIAHVLAQTMNAHRRRRLHCQIAEVLAQRPDVPVGTLAWHWYHPATASYPTRAAARQALGMHDYDDALTFGVMAAEVAESAEDKAEAHELRGDALRRLDRHAEAAAAYARARLAGPATAEGAMVLRRKELRAALVAGTVSPSAAVAEAQKLAGAVSLPPAKQAAVDLLLAEALLVAGDQAAAATAAARARTTALQEGDRGQVADALLVLGAARLREGDIEEAAEAVREAGATYGQMGDLYGLARAAALRSAVAVTAGDLSRAREALDDALVHAERAGVTRLVRQFKEQQRELAG